MFVAPCTSTGTSDLPVKALMPSLPKPPVPHVHTVPSDLRMMLPRAPPQREITSAANAIESCETNSSPTTARTRFVVFSFFICGSFLPFPWPLRISGNDYAVKTFHTRVCIRFGESGYAGRVGEGLQRLPVNKVRGILQ